eukprot:PhF_6_TR11266/c0_g1_i1/m.18174
MSLIPFKKPNGHVQIKKRVWDLLEPKSQALLLKRVLRHYKSVGFPMFPTTDQYRQHKLKHMLQVNPMNYIDLVKKEFIPTQGGFNPGGSFCWSFFPHHIDVKCNINHTPLSTFNHHDRFTRVLRKVLKYNNLSDGTLRRGLKVFCGSQCVSNFPPTVAAAIYDTFGGTHGVVWDMSMGYGGRLCGATIANVKRYIGTDPCTQTFEGLQEMVDFLSKHGGSRVHTKFELHCVGSEEFIPKRNSLDLCFTSPPYFDCERYSTEPTQSFVKYTSKQVWLEDFLGRTFVNCWSGLKDDKYMVINIANVRSYPNLVQDTIKIAQFVGFDFVDKWQLLLKKISLSGDDRRSEPVLVFRKAKKGLRKR